MVCLLAICLAVLWARWSTLLSRVPLEPATAPAAAHLLPAPSKTTSEEPRIPAADVLGNDEKPAASATQKPSARDAAKAIDLNTADAGMLETLPGIGPVLAERIIAYRTQHGAFSNVENLLDVNGIGECKLAAVRGLVCVGESKPGPDREL